MLCLFSALSRGVGALQISIIIFIIVKGLASLKGFFEVFLVTCLLGT